MSCRMSDFSELRRVHSYVIYSDRLRVFDDRECGPRIPDSYLSLTRPDLSHRDH